MNKELEDTDSTGEGIADEDTSIDSIEHPFDPSQIKVSRKPVLVHALMERIRHGEIDLSSEFQRQGGLWKNEAKCRLIESLLIAIPLPTFYFDATDENRWLVVDGLQRLTAMKEFIIDQAYELQGLEFLKQFHKLRYDDLPRSFQRRIQETELQACLIDPGTPEQVKFNIFKRINTGGLPLSFQEIRHALYLGAATKLLQKLVKLPEFLDATDGSISDNRRQAQEMALRALAFTITPPENYPTDEDLDSFLNNTMKVLNQSNKALDARLKSAFSNAMKYAYEIFGNDAFRKRYNDNEARKPISKALFEVWTVNLGALSGDEANILISKKAQLKELFREALHEDLRFVSSISVGTGSVQKVRYRFQKVKEIIQETLRGD